MKKTIISLFAIAICALVSSQARAAISLGAAQWNFDANVANNNNSTAYTGSLPYKANNLNTAVFNAGSNPNESAMTTQTLGANASGSISAGTGDSGGIALAFNTRANGSGKYNVNGSSFVLQLQVASGVSSVSQIKINYNYLATTYTSGSAVNTWTLSANGFQQTASITQDGNWDSTSVTFSGLNLTGGSTFNFTDALSSYASGNGFTAGFDNISFDVTYTLTSVPEPTTYALPLFGLLFLGGTAGRRYLGRLRKA